MSCGSRCFTVCTIGVIAVLMVLVFALADIPSLIVSVIVYNRLIDLNATPLPESNNLQAFAITLIVLSSLTTVFSCCCGGQNNLQNSQEAPQKNEVGRRSLCSSLIVLLMLAQFCVAISILATEKNLASNVRAKTVAIFENNNDTMFDVLQGKFQCCGLGDAGYWNEKLESLPSSCCDPIVSAPCTVELAYADGCLEKIASYFIEQNRLLGWVTIGFQIGKFAFFFILFCGLVSSLLCCVAVHSQQSTDVEMM